MEYLNKLPILLSLLTTTGLGMYFLYQQRSFLDVYVVLIICFMVFYILGKIAKENYTDIINQYLNKKDQDKLKEKEGNSNAVENKVIEGQGNK